MTFVLPMWAFVFPNVGFTIATIHIGNALHSEGIKWVASLMTICIFITWITVLFHHAKAIWQKKVAMPPLDSPPPAVIQEKPN